MTIPTCAVTGAIPGDGGACGDCDPCISGERLVPEAVKRLIVEKNDLINQVGDLHDDAARWRALMASDRIRLWGWAGFGSTRGGGAPEPDPSGYRHFGGEFWSKHSAKGDPRSDEETARAKEILTEYADALLATTQR